MESDIESSLQTFDVYIYLYIHIEGLPLTTYLYTLIITLRPRLVALSANQSSIGESYLYCKILANSSVYDLLHPDIGAETVGIDHCLQNLRSHIPTLYCTEYRLLTCLSSSLIFYSWNGWLPQDITHI